MPSLILPSLVNRDYELLEKVFLGFVMLTGVGHVLVKPIRTLFLNTMLRK